MPKSIDMFNHYLPPEYYDRIIALGGNAHMMNRARKMPNILSKLMMKRYIIIPIAVL